MIGHSECGLIFSFIACGTTFQDSTFCCIFKVILCSLFISLRPLPSLNTSLGIFYYLKFSRCQLFYFCHFLTFPHSLTLDFINSISTVPYNLICPVLPIFTATTLSPASPFTSITAITLLIFLKLVLWWLHRYYYHDSLCHHQIHSFYHRQMDFLRMDFNHALLYNGFLLMKKSKTLKLTWLIRPWIIYSLSTILASFKLFTIIFFLWIQPYRSSLFWKWTMVLMYRHSCLGLPSF